MKLYSLLLYIPVRSPTCLARSSHASFFCCCLSWSPCRTCHKEQGTVSQPLPLFPLEPPFFLVLSLKGTDNEFFDWLILPLSIPLPFTLFSLDRKRWKRKRNRKKKKLFWSFWLRFRRASDSDSDFWFTLDRNAPCASDSIASVNQPNRSQKTSKYSKNISDALEATPRVPLFCSYHIWRHLWSITEQTYGNMESIC